VFIIGSPRSGTSVLAWALAEHPDFWTSGETDFLYHLFGRERLDEMWSVSGTEGGWLHRHGVTRPELMNALGLGLNALISTRTGGRRWVDQSPTYTAMVPAISELFPESLFIHIMRDGRSVVQSMISSGFNTPWATDFTDACRTWAWYVDHAVAFGAQEPNRYLAVPYSFMNENPHACFRMILEFLDADFSEAPGEFLASTRINSSYQPDGPRDGEYRGPANPWEDWSKEQRRIFIAEAGRSFVENRFGTEQELAI
jgi:hypothetical protein